MPLGADGSRNLFSTHSRAGKGLSAAVADSAGRRGFEPQKPRRAQRARNPSFACRLSRLRSRSPPETRFGGDPGRMPPRHRLRTEPGHEAKERHCRFCRNFSFVTVAVADSAGISESVAVLAADAGSMRVLLAAGGSTPASWRAYHVGMSGATVRDGQNRTQADTRIGSSSNTPIIFVLCPLDAPIRAH